MIEITPRTKIEAMMMMMMMMIPQAQSRYLAFVLLINTYTHRPAIILFLLLINMCLFTLKYKII